MESLLNLKYICFFFTLKDTCIKQPTLHMEGYIIDRINQSRTKSGNYAGRTTSSPEAKPKQRKHININLNYKHDDNEGETKK